ncbi:MAG: OmpA family protein [Salinivirgaceae bacterium]|nr:OmpA family protein [Salinivirgaceae bacterium]
MKKLSHILILLTFFFGVAFTSCVSTEKFAASEARVDKLQNENFNAADKLKICNAEVKKLSDEKALLKDENLAALNELNALASSSNTTIVDQAKRLKDLEELFQNQKEVMAKLENSISEALMNYKSDELSVYYKDGSVYVSLAEKLLFKSGSDVVDPKGKEALKTLSKVINNAKNITVLVEGHTDNVPISTKLFEDNWDLSTARATSIVRIMTKDNGFDSSRITASGKGQFHPVKNNDTAIGRAANRRTEIILSPDLKELYALFN